MSTQTTFHAALRDAARPVPPGLLDRWGGQAGKRFSVYRNNVAVSLKEALREGFPATARLLGEANFDAVARGYVAAHAPSSPMMFLYGDQFSQYLTGVQPLAHLGYLPDVAGLEWQMRLAYHAADATPVSPADLQALTPEDFMAAVLRFAPAVRVLQSDFPVIAIRAYALGDGPAPAGAAQSVLITRAEYDPTPTALPADQAALMRALLAGKSVGDALEAAPADLSTLLPLLITNGAITALQKEPTP